MSQEIVSVDPGALAKRTKNDDAHILMQYEGICYTAVGLRWPGRVPFATWEAYLTSLRAMEEGIQWAIGDALLYGESTYGEMYAQAITVTGRTYQTLANYKSVARAFPFEERRYGVPWSHHAAVEPLMSIAPDIAGEVLDAALQKDLSYREIRHDVRTQLAILDIEGANETNGQVERTAGGHIERAAQSSYYGLNGAGEPAAALPAGKVRYPSIDWLEDLLIIVLATAQEARSGDYDTPAATKALDWALDHGYID